MYVPTPIHYFSDEGTDYLVMEEVKWKTIYCLLLEWIYRDLLEYCQNKGHKDFVTEMRNKYCTNRRKINGDWYDNNDFSSFWKRFYSKNTPFFKHDWEAAKWVMWLIEFIWVFTNYFQDEKFQWLNPCNRRNQEEILKILYSEYSKQFPLFTKGETDNAIKNLRIALNSFHAWDVYHRDIWQNLRNLMVWYDWKLAIIDFGKSHNKEDYTNIDESWRYDKDENILIKLKAFEIQWKSDSEKHYLELLHSEKIKETIDIKALTNDLQDLLWFYINEDMIPHPKLSIFSSVKDNYEYNIKKWWWYREHYFYLKDDGKYLSKKEKTMAEEYWDKSSLQVIYLIWMIINLNKEHFEKFKKFINEKLIPLKRKSVKKTYTKFFDNLINIVEKNMQ